jgi:hypothetical protein
MQNTNAKAKTTSAAFGYGSQDIDGISVYTIKLRAKRMGLLDLAINHQMFMGMLPGIMVRRGLGKNGRDYTRYVHVTTNHREHMDMRQAMNMARAMVHDVESSRLVMGMREWLPDYMIEVIDRDYTMRREYYGVSDLGYREAFGNDDLPF